MKKSDLKDKSPVFYIGKGIIILSIIVTSSLSFLLGFFVGKNTAPPAARQVSVITPLSDTAQNNISPNAKEQLPQDPQQIPAALISEVQGPQEKPEEQKIKETPKSAETKKALEPQESKQNKETQKKKENTKALTVQEPNKAQENLNSPKNVKYSVQIGAFKSAAEADSLKTKYKQKGYKTFKFVSKTKKHEKLYKIMVGEFNNKKDAELLSLKIKKVEGLRAFVTIKAGQEEIR
jgi:cell division septation protein DedD